LNPSKLVLTGAGQFHVAVADAMTTLTLRALKTRGRAHLCLAGDPILQTAYRRFAEGDLPWDRVELYPTHGRPTIEEEPGNGLEAIQGARIHSLEISRSHPDTSAREYDGRLPQTLDLVLLALRSDGGVAGLEPGSPVVTDARRRVAALDPPRAAVTVTPRLLLAAVTTVVAAVGPDRAPAVKNALRGPYDLRACPAQVARSATWIVDREAGRLLEESG